LQVAAAAAVALGKIGGQPATATLRQALTDARPPVRSAVAEGCVHAAEGLLNAGKTREAAEIYDQVRQADLPRQRIVEATRGAILARGTDGIPLLVQQLRAQDKRLLQIGLMTARDMPGKAVADAVAAELAGATPERAALLLGVLADRGDAAASPAMLQAARSGPQPTRIGAIGVLRNAGDPSAVPALLEIASDDDAEVAGTAQAALAAMAGKQIDAQITRRLDQAQGKTRAVLIQLVGQRRIDATPALLKAVDDPDALIRQAALTALGETIGQDNLSLLIAHVVSPQHAEDAPVAEKALRAACVRMPDGTACAAQLAAALAEAPLATQIKLLEILGQLHNATSLAALAAAANSGQSELADAATRLLGQTMTLDAGPVLLELAKGLPAGKFQIRALRGYIRLARQFNMPEAQRVEMCVQALEAAERKDEQKMVLEVATRYPSVNMLKVAIQAANRPGLKADATQAAASIAGQLSGDLTEAWKLLEQIGIRPLKIEIVKAAYGAGDKWKDVTGLLQDRAGLLPVIALSSTSYNEAFGGDPAPGIPKMLKIQYRIDGKPGEVVLRENDPLRLPVPP
ncbi:MAG: HEAT repeat domain-containing protein, partial [Planctomycetota bacterium]|nr:HEAT repeat domain-containing protein [Planctomycetota bacterium]